MSYSKNSLTPNRQLLCQKLHALHIYRVQRLHVLNGNILQSHVPLRFNGTYVSSRDFGSISLELCLL
jgi:hypothetical protein